MRTPRVSVLLPVGPYAPWLAETLASLQNQSFTDWELIVILDGDPDANRQIIEQAKFGNPVTIVEHLTSRGIARSLNAGLHRAHGELIARVDADDICQPSRLAQQVLAFDNNPDLVLLGSSAKLIDHSGVQLGERIVPTGNQRLRHRLLSRNSFIHPSVMFKKNMAILVGGYDIHCSRTEDYEFWMRLAICGQIDNLSDSLLAYRIHPHQHTKNGQQLSSTERSKILNSRLQLASELGVSTLKVRFMHMVWLLNRSHRMPKWLKQRFK